MQRFSYSFTVVLFFLTGGILTSEAEARQSLQTGSYSSLLISGEAHPHWLVAHRQGRIDPGESFQSLTGFYAHGNYWQSNNGNWQLDGGSELITKLGGRSETAYFHKLYAELRYRKILLNIGRFDDQRGIYMHSQSSGSMTLSRNATPIPKIRIATDGFVDLPLTDGWMSARVLYSDGILESNRNTSSPYLHQKSLHLSVNIWRLRLIGGIDHHVMWGGDSSELGRRPQGFKDYLRVVFSQSAGDGTDATVSEQLNRLGNTVASYDFGIDYYRDSSTWRIYRTFFIEDRPATRFRSPLDGVWGLGYKSLREYPVISEALYEHIYTITQDARSHVPKGRANYYNHNIYRSGWAYYDQALGNPLLTYDPDEQRFINNMVVGHHVGFAGFINNRMHYEVRLTYTRNYGLCTDRINLPNCIGIRLTEDLPDGFEEIPRDEFRQDQIYAAVRLQYLLLPQRDLHLRLALAADRGEYRANTVGIEFGLLWNFKLN